MKIIRHQMFIGIALLVGVAIGYFVKDEPVQPDGPAEAEAKTQRAVADKGEEASVRALRRRVAELERLLAEKNGNSEIAISNAVAEAARARPPEPPRMSWRERMEEMKKNEPERYAGLTNFVANWRRNRAEQARNKIEFLSSIDTSRMSAGARKTHTALQELIARREDIEQRLMSPNLTDEERGNLHGELNSTNEEFMRLNGEERNILIDETAKELGFTGEDAKEVSATIREVIEATDGGWGGGRRHGGPHGGQRGPGGPGGR